MIWLCLVIHSVACVAAAVAMVLSGHPWWAGVFVALVLCARASQTTDKEKNDGSHEQRKGTLPRQGR